MINDYMSTAEVAKLLKVHANSLAKMRIGGCGPAYMKVGRRVRYPRSDLMAWLDARRRTSTADPEA